MGLGERFRAAREERGLTLSEVGEQVRIRSVYLAAIEEENWKAIGAPVYIRGFLRTYARFLGLDPEEAVSEFNASTGSSPASPSATAAPSSPRQRSMAPLLWIAGIVAIALIGFVIFVYVSPPRAAVVTAQQTATSSPAPSPGTTARPLPQPQPLPVHTLAVNITSASWLRVTIDGSVSIEGTFPRGWSKSFHGKSAVVRAGNAAGVRLTVNGKNVGKLGGDGDVVEKSFVL